MNRNALTSHPASGLQSADNLRVLPKILNPSYRSLVRGNCLVVGSLIWAFFLSDFPHNRPTLLLLLPAFGSILGTADTVRCIRKRWSLYHGGVILCIYMDLMVVTMILVFLLYPYALWMTSSHSGDRSRAEKVPQTPATVNVTDCTGILCDITQSFCIRAPKLYREIYL